MFFSLQNYIRPECLIAVVRFSIHSLWKKYRLFSSTGGASKVRVTSQVVKAKFAQVYRGGRVYGNLFFIWFIIVLFIVCRRNDACSYKGGKDYLKKKVWFDYLNSERKLVLPFDYYLIVSKARCNHKNITYSQKICK